MRILISSKTSYLKTNTDMLNDYSVCYEPAKSDNGETLTYIETASCPNEIIYTKTVLWLILVALFLPIIEIIIKGENSTIISWQVSLVLGVGIWGLIRMVNLVIKKRQWEKQ